MFGNFVDWKQGGRMWWVRLELAADEARKVEGASCTEFLIPGPGVLVQIDVGDVLTMDLRVSSYLWRLGERKLGDDRMV